MAAVTQVAVSATSRRADPGRHARPHTYVNLLSLYATTHCLHASRMYEHLPPIWSLKMPFLTDLSSFPFISNNPLLGRLS
jgi:hypothetical protein